jgi:hypothetical protein
MKKIIIYSLLMSLAFPQLVKAEDIILPVINKPAILDEGTQRELSPAQIAELLPWAKDSKVFLNDLLDNLQGLSSVDKHDRLVEGIKSTVEESAPKKTELLMRYALTRGLAIDALLVKEMDEHAVGTIDAKNRVLVSSVKLALKYYDADMSSLSNKTPAPFVIFGLDYFNFLSELNKSIFDASAQYNIERTALEWLQWDLYRDLTNTQYASQIVKINNSLKLFPTKKITDLQAIVYIRQLKALAGQLKIAETLKQVNQNKEMAAAKSEAEKQAIIDRQEAEKQAIIDRQKAEENRIKSQADQIAFEKALLQLSNGHPVKTSAITAGATVINDNSIRTVEYITDKEQVVLKAVSYGPNQKVVNLSDVQLAVRSLFGLSEGDFVFSKDTIRTVQYIGEKGKIVLKAVSYSYNQEFVSITEITKSVTSYQRFNVGDKVLFKNNIRNIEYLDNTGRVVLKLVPYNFGQQFSTVDQLSKVY